MKIAIRLLGIPPSILALERQSIEIEDGATIQDVLSLLVKSRPHIPIEYFNPCTLMVNSQKASWDTVLSDGDTLLVLRTLGGG